MYFLQVCAQKANFAELLNYFCAASLLLLETVPGNIQEATKTTPADGLEEYNYGSVLFSLHTSRKTENCDKTENYDKEDSTY